MKIIILGAGQVGSSVAANLVNEDNDITLVDVPPYEFLQDTVHQGTYFFLNNNVYFDKDELNTLLNTFNV